MLERHALILARSRAWANTGKRIAANIAIIAIITRSSMSVNARRRVARFPIMAPSFRTAPLPPRAEIESPLC
jgi:hypothetical protein